MFHLIQDNLMNHLQLERLFEAISQANKVELFLNFISNVCQLDANHYCTQMLQLLGRPSPHNEVIFRHLIFLACRWNPSCIEPAAIPLHYNKLAAPSSQTRVAMDLFTLCQLLTKTKLWTLQSIETCLSRLIMVKQ